MLRLTLMFSALLLLAGCGQSGPLYLPGNPSTVESIPPAEPSEPQEDDGEPPKPES